ncbi:MAG: META domain-containing protein [Phormidesmis sp.]
MACYQKWIQQLGVVAVGAIASTLTLADATAVSANEPINTNVSRLQQESWQLVRYKQQPVVADGDITIGFDSDGGMGGFDSCNSYFGVYQVQGDGQITVSTEGRTLVNCFPAGTFSDSDYGSLLSRVTQYLLTDNLLRLETPEGDLVYVAQSSEEFDAEVSYEQWLAESVMPLLDADSPERVVLREEFVFVLEAIAARRLHNYTQEADAVKNYCEAYYYESVGYLERRVPSFESEAERLIASAQNIADQARNTSPLRPLWQRKQTMLLTETSLKRQTYSKQVERDTSLAMVLPSDVSSSSELAAPVTFLDSLFGDISFESEALEPAQPVTHGDLINYFSRQNTQFVEALVPSDPGSIEMNYAEAGAAAQRLSVVLGEVNEVRSLVEELRGAISSAKNKSQPDKSQSDKSQPQSTPTKALKLVQSINPIAYPQIAQSDPIPSIFSIEEIPDVSATDSVYAPLKMFVEELGINMIQPDGNFNGSVPLIRSELAQYLEPVFFENVLLPITLTCEIASEEYLYWSQETQTLQSELRQAISKLD